MHFNFIYVDIFVSNLENRNVKSYMWIQLGELNLQLAFDLIYFATQLCVIHTEKYISVILASQHKFELKYRKSSVCFKNTDVRSEKPKVC